MIGGFSWQHDRRGAILKSAMRVLMHIANLEANRPTVDEMRRQLALELAKARRSRVPLLKLIHGYGSTGVGGKLRSAVRVSLEQAKKRGEIRDFVQGENFRISNENTWAMIKQFRELKQDSDLGRENRGITIVLL